MIDYREVEFAETAHDIDIVLDTIGGEYRRARCSPISPAASWSRRFRFRWREWRSGRLRRECASRTSSSRPTTPGCSPSPSLSRSGQLSATIANTFPLADAAAAHEQLQTNRTAGKLVLTVV